MNEDTITDTKQDMWLKVDEATALEGVIGSFVVSSLLEKFPKGIVVMLSKESVTGSVTASVAEVTLKSSKEPVTEFESAAMEISSGRALLGVKLAAFASGIFISLVSKGTKTTVIPIDTLISFSWIDIDISDVIISLCCMTIDISVIPVDMLISFCCMGIDISVVPIDILTLVLIGIDMSDIPIDMLISLCWMGIDISVVPIDMLISLVSKLTDISAIPIDMDMFNSAGVDSHHRRCFIPVTDVDISSTVPPFPK